MKIRAKVDIELMSGELITKDDIVCVNHVSLLGFYVSGEHGGTYLPLELKEFVEVIDE